MQTIYQNAQEGNIYLLVPLVELIEQNNLPLFNKYKKGRINTQIQKIHNFMNNASKIVNKVSK